MLNVNEMIHCFYSMIKECKHVCLLLINFMQRITLKTSYMLKKEVNMSDICR